MFVLGGLDLRQLLHFTHGAAMGSTARTVGAMVCCFATLLFVSDDLVVDTAIILAVRQAFWGRSIATMVLAETLNGLDAMAAGGEFFRGGSHSCLYMVVGEVSLCSGASNSDWHSSHSWSIFSSFYPLRLHPGPGGMD